MTTPLLIPSEVLVDRLRQALPTLMAVYAFGSQVQGTAGPDSDLDLAVLLPGYADPVMLWALAGDLGDVAGCPVDLVDLRAASTVLQHQVLTLGQRWWARDAQADMWETSMLTDKLHLDSARASLLADIVREGRVHAR
ncbi:type VII toxin-antitoxin system MntA family adenylyltransferase antitoxin [Sphaerotilus sp.]|uniref:type VII toxin-antitoxin system MntA family adenylyltransferase antitoxin n=1 Tax=Sphaerotilus sp. TaxID=2093942 RepID=UPI002ACDC733|nr:nucleotidyltransferase domain-containing protein [Sphaerotilus sp.]MDZ7858904.1 nucleotidyltransferase domain-containing protein [Sphaerotilus sp.]